jgi:uncharacterized protein YwgA
MPGKKALQKTMYVANQMSETYSFRWDQYGPYSEELKYVLEDAISDGLIKVDLKQLQIKDGKQFDMELTKQGRDLFQTIPLDSRTKRGIDLAYKMFKEKTPRQMELLASTHYIIKDNNDEIDVKTIHEILQMLKPNAGFTLDDVNTAVDELKKWKLV